MSENIGVFLNGHLISTICCSYKIIVEGKLKKAKQMGSYFKDYLVYLNGIAIRVRFRSYILFYY